MNIHEIISTAMKDHKNKIEITQWGIISSIASLVFSEYISNIKQKQVPTRKIFVPPIKYVRSLIKPDGDFIKLLEEKLIDGIANNKLFKKYNNAPEFVLFNEDNIEILKTIFDLYIVPNIVRHLPEVIEKKFGLDNDQQQLIIEDSTIDLFCGKPINENQLNYIIEESVLQLLIFIPTMKKDIKIIENNRYFYMPLGDDFIMTIANDQAVCPIHFNKAVMENEDVIDLLNFVTSTSITGEAQDGHMLTSSLFNQICITKLNGINE